MLEIINDIIKITKGDTAYINVLLNYIDGSKYTMQSGDTLTFTARKRPNTEILMQVISNSSEIILPASETKKLIEGECCFDIELKTSLNEIYTIVGMNYSRSGNLIVYPEITV